MLIEITFYVCDGTSSKHLGPVDDRVNYSICAYYQYLKTGLKSTRCLTLETLYSK